jgi:DNA-directed RNA polymerase subunit H (RpoH/RPB5)
MSRKSEITNNVSLAFRVRKNVIRMMEERNYQIPEEVNDLKKLTLEEFLNLNLDRDGIFARFEKRIVFPDNENPIDLDVSVTRDILQVEFVYETTGFSNRMLRAYNDGIRHLLFIFPFEPSSQIRSQIISNSELRIETFSFLNLAYVPIDHYLVPRHRIISESEANRIFGPNFDRSKLLLISFEDPIVRYFGGKIGDIFEITRRTPKFHTLADEYPTYRLVNSERLLPGDRK